MKSLLNEKEKVQLPKIKKELIPYQNNMKVNKLCQCDKAIISKIKLNEPTFLTSQKFEMEKINLYESRRSNNRSKEEDNLYKLLKEKIEISPIKSNKFHYKNKNIRSYNKLNTYMNEALLLKNSMFINRDINTLKKVKVGRLFTLSNTFKKIIINEENSNNKNTIDLKIYKNIYDNYEKSKKVKTLDKKHIKNDISGYIENNWRKNWNCALKYRYNKNKVSIDKMALKIKRIDKKSKYIFDGYQKETDDIFDEAMNVKDKKKKRKYISDN